MPSRTASGLVRFDIDDPADLQVLIDRGLVWRSGPEDLQTVMRAIQEGTVQRAPDKEPPEVRAYLDKVAPIEEPESELLNPLADEQAPAEEAPLA
jgi:hypothetical protein